MKNSAFRAPFPPAVVVPPVRHVCLNLHLSWPALSYERMLKRAVTKMADGSGSQTNASVATSAQSKVSAASSQPQAAQSTVSNTNTAASSNVDTKVRHAGASLGEFLTQLEDYTPTVN